MKNTNKMQHAAYSLGILILFLLCLYFILVYPAIAKRELLNEEVSDLEFQYQRFSSSINKKDEIENEISQLRNSGADTGQFIQAESSALAAAELQSMIKSLIDNSNAVLVSTQVTPAQSDDAFPLITIKVHLRGGIENIFEIFYELEASQIALIIDNLYIQTRNQPGRRTPNRSSQTQVMDEMDVRFDISGFIYQETSA